MSGRNRSVFGIPARALWLLGIGLLAGPLQAGFIFPEPTINYQGRLDHSGQPYTGQAEMTFSLWSSADSGQQIGPLVEMTADVTDGLFSVDLNFGPLDNWDERRYLQIVVDGQILLPRQEIRPSPFALYAFRLFPGSPSVPWNQIGSSVFYTGGNVGIGRSNPAHKLDVAGEDAAIMIEGSAGSSSFLRFKRGGVDADDFRNYIALSSATGSLVTRVAGVDRMRIRENGRVGIGLNSPDARLHVYRPPDSEDTGFLVEMEDETHFSVEDDLTFVKNLLLANGEVRVGTYVAGGGTAVCRTTGTGFAAGFLSQCSSSARYKQDIANLDDALDTVSQLRAVSYRWIQNDEADVGLVAEEVAAVDERLVTFSDQGQVEGVKYGRLAAVLVAALQEQQARHAADIAELNEKLDRLEILLTESARGAP